MTLHLVAIWPECHVMLYNVSETAEMLKPRHDGCWSEHERCYNQIRTIFGLEPRFASVFYTSLYQNLAASLFQCTTQQ